MGYSIIIGERVTVGPGHHNYDPDTGEHFAVDTISDPNAPVFAKDELTGNTNERQPSYTVWSNFCKEAGLTDLFFNQHVGLMRDHPGIADITPAHLELVRQALGRRQFNNPLLAGFDDPNLDGVLARLIWLHFWMDRALRTCVHPCLYNY